MSSLKGKTAFVSGGTRGIGLAIAKRLASEGADIMVAGSSEANCAGATRAITAQSEGRILELETQPMMDIRHHQVETAEPDQIVLIPHVKYAVPKTLIFAVQPELGKMR